MMPRFGYLEAAACFRREHSVAARNNDVSVQWDREALRVELVAGP
jgi:hypothetical protein